ncbi:MFS general substrate transporter [Macroventuria anomochaeta]|uniref:MFS general substrate transporter n=1 Tax=Macroventuria anomochaeta TaxID=301207 RepID=A0ACB6S5X1_9PLEO|nr:MFS general substrate transporter [Macroventuria anomochaeta]KAF2629368.1 MFS general substrate transporter [Macroventuria anomochaeta]
MADDTLRNGFLAKPKNLFQDPEARCRWKLDCLLLVYVFIAGILKEMDQDATTQAYVSGMKEDPPFNSNEIVWFQTYFSIPYAVCIVLAQIIQTKVRPSLFLPACEICWGIMMLFTYLARSATTIYILHFFLGMFSARSWPGIVALLYNWYTLTELVLRLAIFNMSDVAGSVFLGLAQAELHRSLDAFCQYAWSNRANAYFLLYLKDVADLAGHKLYSTYQVNAIPFGGYTFTIAARIVYSSISGCKQWRWQVYIFLAWVHVVSTAVLAVWPKSHATIMAFYFLTCMTEADFPILIAWLGDIL